MTDLGGKVRKSRKRLGWSCAETDRQAGLSAGHTARIEAGRKGPSGHTIAKLAAALKVSVEWLLK